jgi:hypothetical protein
MQLAHLVVLYNNAYCNNENQIYTLWTRKIEIISDYTSGAAEFIHCFNGVSVSQSLVFLVVLCRPSCFSFGHWVVCPSSIYGFWLSLMQLAHLVVLYNNAYCNNENQIYTLWTRKIEIISFVVTLRTKPVIAVNFDVYVNVWRRPSDICYILKMIVTLNTFRIFHL